MSCSGVDVPEYSWRREHAFGSFVPGVTASYVAAFLDVPVGVVYSLARRDEIPHHRYGGKLRFDLDEVSQWWDAGSLFVV